MTKQIEFLGAEYTAPDFVAWVAQDADGTIKGYQWQPFEHSDPYTRERLGWAAMTGQQCTLFKPEFKCVAECVGYTKGNETSFKFDEED